MFFRLLADAVVLLHFLWILFLIFGAIPGRRYRSIQFIHIGGLAFALIIQVFGWYCPLTHLEVRLRSMHDPTASYTGSFIIHYLEKIIYIAIDRWVFALLTIVLCLFNVWIYRKRRR